MTINEKGLKLTLSDLYNENIVYNSRPSYVSNPWLKPEEHQSNFLTGREMLIADSMPMIVHEASITEKLDQLFNLVGKKVPTNTYQFKNHETYEALLNRIVKEEGKDIFSIYS